MNLESQSSLASSAYGQALNKSRSVSQETSQGQLYSNAPIFPQDSFLQRSVSQPVQPQAAYYINAKHVSISGYVPPRKQWPTWKWPRWCNSTSARPTVLYDGANESTRRLIPKQSSLGNEQLTINLARIIKFKFTSPQVIKNTVPNIKP